MQRITWTISLFVGLGLAFAPLAASAGTFKNVDAVMLNPQPLPPKEKISAVSRFDTVTLNPQPLPPKLVGKAQFKSMH
ncbi:MAG: hypothetical protein ACM3MH_02110 [Actinomycetota bacterium]